jgi:hypothetical protein
MSTLGPTRNYIGSVAFRGSLVFRAGTAARSEIAEI